MTIAVICLLIAALVSFIIATFVGARFDRINIVALGLAFATVAALVQVGLG